jgi:rare lipoprotein A
MKRISVALAVAAAIFGSSVARAETVGEASFYGMELAGKRKANGERFDPNELTAAHRTLPFGTRVRVTNLANGRSVTLRITDRGPFVKGRIIDVSLRAARELGFVRRGVTKVRVETLR